MSWKTKYFVWEMKSFVHTCNILLNLNNILKTEIYSFMLIFMCLKLKINKIVIITENKVIERRGHYNMTCVGY